MVASIIIVVACAWSFGIARTCWFAGDYMIGFSPFILFALPVAGILLVVGIAYAATRKSKLITICSILGCIIIIGILFNMHRITRSAWQHSLSEFSATNQTALRDADFSTSQFTDADFPDDLKMTAVDGFESYCDQHHAAPNGEFRGFVYSSIKHIYVNKIRHGLRGVAWIPESDMIPSTSDYDYQYSGIDHWYI